MLRVKIRRGVVAHRDWLVNFTDFRCSVILLHSNVCVWFLKVVNYHHHHISFMELGHLLTRSGLTYPEVSSKVYHDSFC